MTWARATPGRCFAGAGRPCAPAQVSTKVDYGVYLQFWTRRGGQRDPAVRRPTPQNVTISGLDPAAVSASTPIAGTKNWKSSTRAISRG